MVVMWFGNDDKLFGKEELQIEENLVVTGEVLLCFEADIVEKEELESSLAEGYAPKVDALLSFVGGILSGRGSTLLPSNWLRFRILSYQKLLPEFSRP